MRSISTSSAAKQIDNGLILKALEEGIGSMFGVVFSIFVLVALLSIFGEFVMRVPLTRRDTSRDRLVWWRLGGDDVAATYEEVFPHSRLPSFRRFVFWLFIACAGALVFSMLVWKSN